MKYRQYIFRSLSLFTLAILAPSCSADKETKTLEARDLYPPLRLVVLDNSLYPGSPATLALIGLDDDEDKPLKAVLYQDGALKSQSRFFPSRLYLGNEELMVAILGIPLDSKAGEAMIEVKGGRWPAVRRKGTKENVLSNDDLRSLDIQITEREYPESVLRMDAVNTALIYKPDPEKTRQSEELWRIFSSFDPGALYSEAAFTYPTITTRRSSGFGSRRTYIYTNGRRSTSSHLGIDFPAVTGTPVYAPGPGKVLLARDRIVSGKSIVIEHLPGFLSIYYHLDSILCEAGNMVKGEEMIGTVGSTGFSTGPHLHWEIRSGTVPIDPDAATRAPLIDKELIINTMKEKYGRTAEGG